MDCYYYCKKISQHFLMNKIRKHTRLRLVLDSDCFLSDRYWLTSNTELLLSTNEHVQIQKHVCLKLRILRLKPNHLLLKLNHLWLKLIILRVKPNHRWLKLNLFCLSKILLRLKLNLVWLCNGICVCMLVPLISCEPDFFWLCLPQTMVLASGGQDGAICLWDVLTGSRVSHVFGHRGDVTSLVCTTSCVISSGLDDLICIWDRSTGIKLYSIQQVL